MAEVESPSALDYSPAEVAGVMVSPPSRPEIDREAGQALANERWAALEPYRVVIPATFLALWIGFSLLPDAQGLLRLPMALALAALVGAGTEICAGSPARRPMGRLARGTVWIIPTAATLVIVMLLGSLGGRAAIAPPVLAVVVLGALYLQAVEVNAVNPALSWTRPLNTGLAFALAFAAFILVPDLQPLLAAIGYGAVAVLASLVVLRGCRVNARQLIGYVGVTTVFIVELGLILHDVRPPLVAASVPLLGLYAVSTTAQALLDRAPRRAYIEVGVVTGATLLFVLLLQRR